LNYQVRIEKFQGPLDLLLYFIRKNELDIMDIPIANITKEYLDYLKAIQTLNISVAGEFILMAATLMRIKAKMLLPKPEPENEDEIEDPRTQLVYQLMEYQRFKESAATFSSMKKEQELLFLRPENEAYSGSQQDDAFYLENISIYHLVNLYKQVLDRLPPVLDYEVNLEEIHVKEQIAKIKLLLKEQSRIIFSELLQQSKSRVEVISTFLGILEMIKNGEINISQKTPFGEIVLKRIEA
tara:strand:- start:11595 stop:12314 length:720 start_codon:yes stop_codon:yes gene_type:complete